MRLVHSIRFDKSWFVAFLCLASLRDPSAQWKLDHGDPINFARFAHIATILAVAIILTSKALPLLESFTVCICAQGSLSDSCVWRALTIDSSFPPRKSGAVLGEDGTGSRDRRRNQSPMDRSSVGIVGQTHAPTL